MVAILELLKGGDIPRKDHSTFLKAQILFWLIGATDGHAKNFSLFLGPKGRFRLTPIYDVLSAQPSLECRQIERKQMRLAMSVGDSRHYRLDEIEGRHFVQTAKRARLPESLALDALKDVCESADKAMAEVEKQLPSHFPEKVHLAVSKGLRSRMTRLL